MTCPPLIVDKLRERIPKHFLPERATDQHVINVAVQYMDLLARNDRETREKNRELCERIEQLTAAIEQHRSDTQCCTPCADAVTEERIGADGELWAVLTPEGTQ